VHIEKLPRHRMGTAAPRVHQIILSRFHAASVGVSRRWGVNADNGRGLEGEKS